MQRLLLGDPYLSLEIETFLVCPFSSGVHHTNQRLKQRLRDFCSPTSNNKVSDPVKVANFFFNKNAVDPPS